MKEESKSCFTKFSQKESLVIFAMSLFLFGLMFVRIEVVHRKAGVMEAKLVKRIQRIEDEMQMKAQTIVKEMLLTEGKTTTGDSRVHASVGKSRATVFEYKDQDVAQALKNTSLSSLFTLNVYKYTHSCKDHFKPFTEYHGELFLSTRRKTTHPFKFGQRPAFSYMRFNAAVCPMYQLQLG